MAKESREARLPGLPIASFLRKFWIDIVMFLVAGVLIGSGIYARLQDEWTLRPDIKEYNQGVLSYEELLWAPLVSSEESLLSVYPHAIERAGGSFDKASSESKDRELVSLASYNSGTLLGRTAFLSQPLPNTNSYVVMALTKLGDAVRNDPHNEDAKFNLELLEKVLETNEVEGAGAGPGYSPGAIYKGY